MGYKDRLEHPIEFLESMLGNFTNPKFQQAQHLTYDLIEIVKDKDKGRLIKWIKSINGDPESFGSAFYMVYQFAEDYFNKMNVKEIRDNQIDGLTGCRSKYGLELDLTLAVMNAGRDTEKRYRNNFLCIDIDNFQQFLDYHGYGPSDQMLITIAERLHNSYPENKIYRHGGDEFVVAGVDVLRVEVMEVLDVSIKHSIVDVDTLVVPGRHHRATSWVMLHIHSGIVKSTTQGLRINCRERES